MERLNDEQGFSQSDLNPTEIDLKKYFQKKYGREYYLTDYIEWWGITDEEMDASMVEKIKSQIKVCALLNKAKCLKDTHMDRLMNSMANKELRVSDLIASVYCSAALYDACSLLRRETIYRTVERAVLLSLAVEKPKLNFSP